MAPKVASALVDMGWDRRGIDGQNEWWTRDRVVAARQRLGANRDHRSSGLAIA
jgi:hypothetical protein